MALILATILALNSSLHSPWPSAWALPKNVEKSHLFSDDLDSLRLQTRPGLTTALDQLATNVIVTKIIPVEEFNARSIVPSLFPFHKTIIQTGVTSSRSIQPDWNSLFVSNRTAPIQFGVHINAVGETWPDEYELNSNVEFKPASNAKLFSTLMALGELGTQFRFHTEMTAHWVGKKTDGIVRHLIIHASGDPSWGLWDSGTVGSFPELTSIASSLRYLGIKKVVGPITVVAPDVRFDELRPPPGWSFGDTAACFGAPYQAINLQTNCATFRVTGPSQGQWLEIGVPIPVTVQAKLGASTELILTAQVDSKLQPTSYKISGTIAAGDAASFVLPIPDSRTWAINVLTAKLKALGVLFEADNLAPTIEGETLTYTYTSRTVGQMMIPFLKLSINIVGDGFLRYLGSLRNPNEPNLWVAGADVLRTNLTAAGIKDFLLIDGSGVSHNNRVLPTTLLSTLTALRIRSDFPTVWQSLPIAGVDGTLASRMKNSNAQNFLRAKTGTLTGTYSLSGYVPEVDTQTKATRYIPFVILTQTTSNYRTLAREVQNQAGILLSNFVRAVP